MLLSLVDALRNRMILPLRAGAVQRGNALCGAQDVADMDGVERKA